MLATYLIAAAITFVVTVVLTIAGVGAAFVLIPIYYALGIDLPVAMAVALLLNSVAMVCAQPRFWRERLVMFDVALPIILVATPLSPVGAWISRYFPTRTLLWLFVVFLIFAATMMLFYPSRSYQRRRPERGRLWFYGGVVGAVAGFVGGLLGVGGGNIIVPVLVWLGFDPKRVSATTSFVVIFSSLAGFLGHATLGHVSWPLLGLSALASAVGAMVGAWLMSARLNRAQVKVAIGVVLYTVAAKMLWKLVTPSLAHGRF